MAKEEQILFPAIRSLELQNGSVSFPFGSVANPIGMMEHEHDDAGNALRRLRQLTDDYTPPSDACPTYRVLLESLRNLEQDLHLHIHKENNILFPRAKAFERSPGSV
jgi:regulator of cell morphogenesis and NO signaling